MIRIADIQIPQENIDLKNRQVTKNSQPLDWYKKGKVIVVNDKMQSNYAYVLSENPGRNFDARFRPELTPRKMLEFGVFEGKYCRDCRNEFPVEWFAKAKFVRGDSPDPDANHFHLKSRMSLSDWQEKGWINSVDPRGWFQWYMRYYLGRRIPIYDEAQISRWRSFARHVGQLRANCKAGDLECRKRQRQAVLQWAYNPLF